MKRSKRKDLKVYCVYSSCKYDYLGQARDGDELLGVYFSKEVALHDLIDVLNLKCEAKIGEYTEEALNDFIFQHQEKCIDILGICPNWRIDEVIVNDKEKLMEVI
jgi:hypothetical protein